ncbi:MAG: hypothetical protein ABIJ09_09470 [Pseudomonadota bacterium]
MRLTTCLAMTLVAIVACTPDHALNKDVGHGHYDSGTVDAAVLDTFSGFDTTTADTASGTDASLTGDAAACSRSCGLHEQCNTSSGECECVDTFHRCSMACVDSTSTAHCGSFCDPCPTTANGTASCDGVACSITCDQDYLFCGARCALCPTEGVATTTCASGSCVVATCQQGYQPCGDGCCSFSLDIVEAGAKPRMALDALDLPWLVYLQNATTLRLASPSSTGWQTGTVVQDTADVIQFPDIALDDTGIPHVVYALNHTYASSSVVHAVRETSGWVFETVVQASGTFLDTHLAIDGDGLVSVVFHNWDDGTLLLASNPAGQWSVEEVAQGYQLGRYCDVELDDSGAPHLSFMANNELRYAYHDVAGWQFQVVAAEAGTQYISDTTLRFGPQGRPRIGAFRSSPRTVLYAAYNGLTWDVEDVQSNLGTFAGGVSMDLAADGMLHLSYYAYDAGEIRHASRSSSGWVVEVVDRTQADEHSQILVDSGGGLHIAYTDGSGKVIHAH